jgi:ABC-type transport system involved in cytochrome c biogenesis permease subunit
MQSQPFDPQTMHAAMAMLALMPVFGLIAAVIIIIPLWFIWKKAGFSPWLSLLSILPLVNLIMLYVLAFSEWKVAPVGQQTLQAQYPPQYPRV